MARTRTKKTSAEKRRKKVNISLIKKRDAGPYKIMEELIGKHHGHLTGAKIAIAWRHGWKADVDGRIKLVSVVKGSDLTRELAEWDFIILLNHEVWNNAAFTGIRQTATMDHGLCHCDVARDKNGEPIEDEKKRTVYRLRRADVVEFKEIIRRYGPYTPALDEFLEAASEAASRPLLTRQMLDEDAAAAKGKTPKGTKEKDADDSKHGGVNRVKGLLPPANGEASNGAATNGEVNGHAHPLDAMKEPARIKLKETIEGHPKLKEGTGHDVARTGPGGGVMIKGKAGKLVTLTPYQYSIVE